MNDLQSISELMTAAETRIRECLTEVNPGVGASRILQAYQLEKPKGKDAFVAVMAMRVAVCARQTGK